jgi:hypothetical protein
VIRRGHHAVDELAAALDDGASPPHGGRTHAPDVAGLVRMAADLRAMSKADPMVGPADPVMRREVLTRLAAAGLRRRRTRFASSLAAAVAVLVLAFGTVLAGPGNVADAVGGAVGSVLSVLQTQLGLDGPRTPDASGPPALPPSPPAEGHDRPSPSPLPAVASPDAPPTAGQEGPGSSPPGVAPSLPVPTSPPVAVPSSAPTDAAPPAAPGPPDSPGPPEVPGSPGPPMSPAPPTPPGSP